jgi:hypothetical protein
MYTNLFIEEYRRRRVYNGLAYEQICRTVIKK